MKALVVFGTERGGTAGLAQMIGAAFQHEGWSAEVRDATTPGGLGNADIVVIGGALYFNRWHRDARRFVAAHRARLVTMPVWLFSSGPLDDTARRGDLAPVPQVREIARSIEARGHMTFGGRLEPAAKGLMARRMAKTYAGDWRDPQHVAEWVHQIVHSLVPADVVVVPEAERREVRVPSQRTRRAPATT